MLVLRGIFHFRFFVVLSLSHPLCRIFAFYLSIIFASLSFCHHLFFCNLVQDLRPSAIFLFAIHGPTVDTAYMFPGVRFPLFLQSIPYIWAECFSLLVLYLWIFLGLIRFKFSGMASQKSLLQYSHNWIEPLSSIERHINLYIHNLPFWKNRMVMLQRASPELILFIALRKKIFLLHLYTLNTSQI